MYNEFLDIMKEFKSQTYEPFLFQSSFYSIFHISLFKNVFLNNETELKILQFVAENSSLDLVLKFVLEFYASCLKYFSIFIAASCLVEMNFPSLE